MHASLMLGPAHAERTFIFREETSDSAKCLLCLSELFFLSHDLAVTFLLRQPKVLMQPRIKTRVLSTTTPV